MATKKRTLGDTTPNSSATHAGVLGDQLCFALYAATNEVTRAFRPLLDEINLTYPQYLIILVLLEHKSCRLGEIARKLHLATHAVSPIIDRMEESGLVRRVQDPSDGRAVVVELTAAGARLDSHLADAQESARCSTHLDDHEVVALRAMLHDLVKRMEADD